jgi:hypothetical protein
VHEFSHVSCWLAIQIFHAQRFRNRRAGDGLTSILLMRMGAVGEGEEVRRTFSGLPPRFAGPGGKLMRA